ncbi:MAG: hypothetical protein A2516_00970 [Alphaproteobacteria bacterium RIFOXYD12_FULL_60_8]|nr:MAG: hypothetical protein A2516_00970 [Alphaproteobacteria bacterium RIFOXYD12_FULL_60_8]
MSKTIESTVEKLPQDLAMAGVVSNQHVFVTVLDEDELAKLEALRADLQVGLNDLDAGRAGPLDIETFIAELHEKHAAKSPAA